MYDHVRDSWHVSNGAVFSCIVAQCHSVVKPGRVMEGTRLTMQVSLELERCKAFQSAGGSSQQCLITPFALQSKPPDGYEVAIRTPCTPPRWKEFDEELTHAFMQLSSMKQCNPVCAWMGC
jgi:hypothetical protein